MRDFILSTTTGATDEILRLTSPKIQQPGQKDAQDQPIEDENKERQNINNDAKKNNNSMESTTSSGKNTTASGNDNKKDPTPSPMEETNAGIPDGVCEAAMFAARFHADEINKSSKVEREKARASDETSIFKRIDMNTQTFVKQSLVGVQSQIQNENSTVRKIGKSTQMFVQKTVYGFQSQIEDGNSTIRKIGSDTEAFVKKSVTGVQLGVSSQLENEDSTIRVMGINAGSLMKKSVEGVKFGVVGVSAGIQSQLKDENSTLIKVGMYGETLVVELRSQIENENSTLRKLGSNTEALVKQSVAGVSAGVQSELEQNSTIRKAGSSSYEWASQWIQPLSNKAKTRVLNKHDNLEAAIAASTTPLDGDFVERKYGGYSVSVEEEDIGALSTWKKRANDLIQHVNKKTTIITPLKQQVLSVLPSSRRPEKEVDIEDTCSLQLFPSDSLNGDSCKDTLQPHKVNSKDADEVNNTEAFFNQLNSIYPNLSVYMGYVTCNSIYSSLILFLEFTVTSSKLPTIIIISSKNDVSQTEPTLQQLKEITIENEEVVMESTMNIAIDHNSLYSVLIPYLAYVNCNSLYPDVISFLGFTVISSKLPNRIIISSKNYVSQIESTLQQPKDITIENEELVMESTMNIAIDSNLLYFSLIPILGYVNWNSLYPDVISFLGFTAISSKLPNRIDVVSKNYVSQIESTLQQLKDITIENDEVVIESTMNIAIDSNLLYFSLIPFLGYVNWNSLYPDVISFLGFVTTVGALDDMRRKSPLPPIEESSMSLWKRRATYWIQLVSENGTTSHLTQQALSVLHQMPEKVIGVVDAVTAKSYVSEANKTQQVFEDTSSLYPNLKSYLGFQVVLSDSANPVVDINNKLHLTNTLVSKYNYQNSEISECILDSKDLLTFNEAKGGHFFSMWKKRATNIIQQVSDSNTTNRLKQKVLSVLHHTTTDKNKYHEKIVTTAENPRDMQSTRIPSLNLSSPVKSVPCKTCHNNEKTNIELSDFFPKQQSTVQESTTITGLSGDSLYPNLLSCLGFNTIQANVSEDDVGNKAIYRTVLSENGDDLQLHRDNTSQLPDVICSEALSMQESIIINEENSNTFYPSLISIMGFVNCCSLYPDLMSHMGYNAPTSAYPNIVVPDDDDDSSTSSCSSSSMPITHFLSEDKLSLWKKRANDLINQMCEGNKPVLNPQGTEPTNVMAAAQDHETETCPSLVDVVQTVNVGNMSNTSLDLNAMFTADDNLTISSGSTFSSAPAPQKNLSQAYNLTNVISSRFQAFQIDARKLPPSGDNRNKIILKRSNSYPDFSVEASVFKDERRDCATKEDNLVPDIPEEIVNANIISSPGSQEWAPCRSERLLKSRRGVRGRISLDCNPSSSRRLCRSSTPTRGILRDNPTTSISKRRRRRPKISLDSSLDNLDSHRRSLESIMNEDRSDQNLTSTASLNKSFDSHLQPPVDAHFQHSRKRLLKRMVEHSQCQESLTSLYQKHSSDSAVTTMGSAAAQDPEQTILFSSQSFDKRSKQQQIQDSQKLLTATTNIILLHLLSLSHTYPSPPVEPQPTDSIQIAPEKKQCTLANLKNSSITVNSTDASAITIRTHNINDTKIFRPSLSRDSSLFISSTLTDLNFSSDEDEDEKKSQDGNSILTAVTSSTFFHSLLVELPNASDDLTVVTGIRDELISNPFQYVSCIKWLQMVAKWKHSQMMEAMTALPISHHYMQQYSQNIFAGNSSASTSISSGTPSLSFTKRKSSKRGRSISKRMKSFLKSSPNLASSSDTALHQLPFSDTFDNLNGFSLKDVINDEDIPLLSLYFVKLGAVPYYLRKPKCPSCNSQNGIYRWEKKIIKQCILKPNPSIQDYVSQARAHLSLFSQIMERVMLYTTQNSSSPTCRLIPSENLPSYSINIKTLQSIKRKARRKYNGDISQVKDILRAQVVLPDEGSIVCALLALKKEKEHVNIVRMKNLFYCVDVAANKYVESNLPTGYRHLLVNLRFSDGFVSEFQVQLAPMYDLLGEEGYSLHSDLNKLELWKEDESLEHNNILTEKELGICSACRKLSFSSDAVHQSRQNDTFASPSNFDSYLQSLVCHYHLCCQRSKNAYNNMYTSFACLSTSCHRMIDLLVTIARHDVQTYPRDIARHICLAEILKAKHLLHERKSDRDHVIDVLKQSLVIADQAAASGMIGWLEYGESKPLDRMMERPLYILANLASFYAHLNNWSLGRVHFWTLLLRCEQLIPLYHPFTLTCMLDLAACISAIGDVRCASQVVQRASARLAFYLAEQEKQIQHFNNIMSMQRQSWETEEDLDDSEKMSAGESLIYQHHRTNPFLEQLQTYAARLKQYITRPMMNVLGASHQITLLFHCYVADVLSVLANCRTSTDAPVAEEKRNGLRMNPLSLYARASSKHSQLQRNSHAFWKEAGIHYSYALQRWLSVHNGIYYSNTLATCSALARTLREINSPDSAVNLLSSIVSSISTKTQQGIVPNSGNSSIMSLQHPLYRRIRPQIVAAATVEKNMAICLWWLSVYFAECNPNERGRIRALSLLHASSETLLRSQELALSSSPFIEMLHIVEQEAKKLLVFNVPDDIAVSSDNHQKGSSEYVLV